LREGDDAPDAGVLYPFFGILLSPIFAAAAMSFSFMLVIGHALISKLNEGVNMKKILVVTAAAIGLAAATAFGQMNTGQGGGMMDHGWGWGMGYGWGFGTIIVILVVVGVVYMMKRK